MATLAQSADTEAPKLLQTPLADWHVHHAGRLVDFAGWAMPVQYGSIVEEHNATRTSVGLFDVSHMGRFAVSGHDAGKLLDRVLTRRVSTLSSGKIRYALVCNAKGGILDDVLAGPTADNEFALVVNASNRAKLWAWFNDHAADLDVELTDNTTATAMIAVQGPNAVATVSKMADSDVASLKYYTGGRTNVAGVACQISRTGYTGEDGFELVCAADKATALWQALIDAGGKPCGLAARDTLRLEAAMPLYGHELDEQRNPLEAGLEFAVNFTNADGSPREFVGSDALREIEASETPFERVGLVVEGRRPPRETYTVLASGQECGVVTSGTASPTLGTLIAMAYVDRSVIAAGAPLSIDIRGTHTPATVTPLPFYRRA